jgi:hypothetical protein
LSKTLVQKRLAWSIFIDSGGLKAFVVHAVDILRLGRQDEVFITARSVSIRVL